MHDLGASALALSLMATAASAPFFLFTLPAGAIGDIVNRRTLIVSAVLWQGICSGVLALKRPRLTASRSIICSPGLNNTAQ
jgi:MFS family permease